MGYRLYRRSSLPDENNLVRPVPKPLYVAICWQTRSFEWITPFLLLLSVNYNERFSKWGLQILAEDNEIKNGKLSVYLSYIRHEIPILFQDTPTPFKYNGNIFQPNPFIGVGSPNGQWMSSVTQSAWQTRLKFPVEYAAVSLSCLFLLPALISLPSLNLLLPYS